MSPLSALVYTTPHEAWSDKNPSVAHLNVFRCDAFVHAPKEKRRKLEKKEVKCIFIGYKIGMKGYMLWDPSSRITMYSLDVFFREVRGKFKPEEVVQTDNNPKTVYFESRIKEDDSDESTEYEEEVNNRIWW
jgi:hypothetical protein